MNILIAEDQNVIRMVLEMAMLEWGFDYDTASNGLEAVNRAKAKPGEYDLCIMDVSMPVMDGLEATQIIREEVGYFPILGYSTDIAMRERCMDVGMDDFLLKPASKEKLLETITNLTERK